MKAWKFPTVDHFLSAYAERFEHLSQRGEDVKNLLALCKSSPDAAVLHGIWAHEKALAAGLAIEAFLLCPAIVKWPECRETALRSAAIAKRCCTVTERTFARLSGYGDPDGILSLARIPARRPETLPIGRESVVFVLDGLVKPGNIGVILRTCDGAGVSAVATCHLRTRVTHPNAVKASMGAAFSVPIAPFGDAAACKAWLMENGFTVYIADPNAGRRYDRVPFSGRVAVVLGNEHNGASRAWYDGSAVPLAIPMSGSCDSLNVSIAAAVLAYEIQSKKAARTQERGNHG